MVMWSAPIVMTDAAEAASASTVAYTVALWRRSAFMMASPSHAAPPTLLMYTLRRSTSRAEMRSANSLASTSPQAPISP